MLVHKRTLFQRPSQVALPLFLLAPLDNVTVRRLVVPCLVPARRLAPRRHGMAATGSLSFTTAQRMINRIHRHAAHGGTNALPAIPAGLANVQVLVIQISKLPDRSHALNENSADF